MRDAVGYVPVWLPGTHERHIAFVTATLAVARQAVSVAPAIIRAVATVDPNWFHRKKHAKCQPHSESNPEAAASRQPFRQIFTGLYCVGNTGATAGAGCADNLADC